MMGKIIKYHSKKIYINKNFKQEKSTSLSSKPLCFHDKRDHSLIYSISEQFTLLKAFIEEWFHLIFPVQQWM